MAGFKPTEPCWTTEKELAHIDGIGEHMKFDGEQRAPSKQDFLRGYIEGAKKRVNWGAVDSTAVIHHAKALLAKCNG